MIYSCFDAKSGLYRYFQDGDQRAINADLPVPSFRSSTKLGVPATEAGRPLPSGAVPAGSGWRARGMIVQCGSSAGFSGFGDIGTGGSAALGLLALGVGALLVMSDQPLSGALAAGIGIYALAGLKEG